MMTKNTFNKCLVKASLLSGLLWVDSSQASPESFDVIRPEKSTDTHQVDGLSWKEPNFQNQEKALGYDPTAFAASPELKKRVQFWVDVYSKYPSSQGVLHDRLDLSIVYEVLDFSSIVSNTTLNFYQVEKAKELAVKRKREEILERLSRIKSYKTSEGLSGDELRYWKMFPEERRQEIMKVAASKEAIRFQLGQKDYFQKGIYYSGRYLRQMENIFRNEGVPVELTRLPFVESSFNIFARSKVGASGIWQFMRNTGKSYMKVNVHVDERNDPLIASRAAARLLRSNYKVLNSWPLAITAYNHGPSGMKRLVSEYKTDKIHELIERVEGGRFGFASKNFYACFLAAVEVESHANINFGKPEVAAELPFENFVLPKSANYRVLLKLFDSDLIKTELLNPQFTTLVKRGRLPMPKGSKIRIPPRQTEKFMSLLQSNNKEFQFEAKGKSSAYQVTIGDSLFSIAQTFGVSMKSLIERNSLENPKMLKPGQTLFIPVVDD